MISVDFDEYVGARCDNHTRMNAEAPCFTPSTHTICVLSHSTPGIDQASQYCTPKTVSNSVQTLPVTKTRKVQTEKLHSVHRVDCEAQFDEQCSIASQTDERAATHVATLTDPTLSLCDNNTITDRPCETHGTSKGAMVTDVHDTEILSLTKRQLKDAH